MPRELHCQASTNIMQHGAVCLKWSMNQWCNHWRRQCCLWQGSDNIAASIYIYIYTYIYIYIYISPSPCLGEVSKKLRINFHAFLEDVRLWACNSRHYYLNLGAIKIRNHYFFKLYARTKYCCCSCCCVESDSIRPDYFPFNNFLLGNAKTYLGPHYKVQSNKRLYRLRYEPLLRWTDENACM